MAVSKFILVEWVGENKFTVITRNGLCNSDDKLKSDEDLIGTTVPAFFNKKTYDGKIVQCGKKLDMKHEMEVLTNQYKCRKDKRKETDAAASFVADDIDDVLNFIENQDAHDEEPNWKELYNNASQKLDDTEKELNSLKRKHAELQDETQKGPKPQDTLVDIGGGVTITSTQLSCIASMSNDPPKFARNLMRAVFTKEELTGKSLFGNWCNANPTGIPLPPLEPLRRDSVLEYTYRKFGCSTSIGNDIGRKALRSKVTASLSNMLRKMK